MDALFTPERKDKGATRKLSNDIMSAIYDLKDKFPRLNATQIRLKLLEDGMMSSDVSVRCVQRFVKNWNLRTGSLVGLKDRKAFEEGYFGAMWQADSCYFPYIPNETGKSCRTYLIMALDDHSRMIVGAQLFFQDNGVNFQKVLKNAVATYGIPNKLYCDNGGPYVNNQTTWICDNLGTVLIHAPVRDGAAKGKAERAFRTIKERWLYGLDISAVKSLDQFNRLLVEYVRAHNQTLNTSTKETPIHRFLNSRQEIKKPESQEWLHKCFLHRIRRNVRKDATVNIDKIQYDVPMQFVGQTVEIRYLPGNYDSAHILYEDRHYALKKTNKEENARTKRSTVRIDYTRASDFKEEVRKGD